MLAISTGSIAADNEDFTLEEIIVTAQKRAQSLQDVPIAVSAITSQTFDRQALLNLSEALELTPNIEVVENDSGANVILRGVSRGSVAILLDGVAQLGGATTFSSPITDIERVEVLRGPQGSIYGRNAAGGVINYITKAPSEEFEGSVKADFGNYGFSQYSGMLNVPVVEGKVSTRFNAFYEDRGGWVDNEFDGSKLESAEKYGFRGQILFTPNDNLSARFMVQYNNNKPSSHTAYYQTGSELMDFWVAHVNAGLGKNLPTIGNDAFSGTTNLDGGVSLSTKQTHAQAHLTWDDDWGTLLSITGYTDRNRKADNLDTDASALDLLVLDKEVDNTDFSQEFRFVSNTDGKLEYVAGLYYERETSDVTEITRFGEDGDYIASSLFGNAFATGINSAIGVPLLPTDFTPLFTTGSFLGIWDYDEDHSVKKTYAAYINATYKLTEKLHLTAGGRLSRVNDVRSELGIPTVYNLQQLAGPELAPFAAFVPDAFTIPGAAVQNVPIPVYKKTDWSAAVKGTYFVSDDIMVYGSVSRGFTPGRVSALRVNSTDIQIDELEPEVIWNDEVGTKTSLMDNRLQLNGSLYFLNYSNFRTFTLVDNAFQPADGGTMHNYGFELEAIARPIQGLTLMASVGYTNATYKDVARGGENRTGCYLGQSEANGCIDGTQLRTGQQVEGSAKWNG
ncbi:MAG: TonB-dependent receptor, partial [Kordiimonadaceae bacterium]|nr:TonB-dependent receptor [Kordiimonadaceae bacterium]